MSIISFTIATVFILAAGRISFLRRYAVPASLLYGFGVFIVRIAVRIARTAEC